MFLSFALRSPLHFRDGNSIFRWRTNICRWVFRFVAVPASANMQGGIGQSQGNRLLCFYWFPLQRVARCYNILANPMLDQTMIALPVQEILRPSGNMFVKKTSKHLHISRTWTIRLRLCAPGCATKSLVSFATILQTLGHDRTCMYESPSYFLLHVAAQIPSLAFGHLSNSCLTFDSQSAFSSDQHGIDFLYGWGRVRYNLERIYYRKNAEHLSSCWTRNIRKHKHHKHGSYLNDWGRTNGRASPKHLEVWLSRSVAEIQPFQSSSYLPWKVKARQRKANPVKMYCTDSLEWKVDISIVVSLSNLPNPNLTKQPDFWSSKSLVFSLCFSHLPSGHLCTSVMETASSAEEPTSADGSSGLWLSLQVQTCKEALDSLKRHQKTSVSWVSIGFHFKDLQDLTRFSKETLWVRFKSVIDTTIGGKTWQDVINAAVL